MVELYEYSSSEKLVHLAITVESQLLKKTHFKTTHNDGFYKSSWKEKKSNFFKKPFLPNLKKIPLTILEFLNPQLLHLSHPPKPQVKNVLNVWVLGILHLIIFISKTRWLRRGLSCVIIAHKGLGDGRGLNTNPLKGHQNVKLRQPLELWSKRGQEDAFYMS